MTVKDDPESKSRVVLTINGGQPKGDVELCFWTELEEGQSVSDVILAVRLSQVTLPTSDECLDRSDAEKSTILL